MIYFTDHEIEQLLTEDVPYYDLTTSVLKLENKPAKIQFITKEDTVICCTEEALKMFSKLAITPTLITTSGEYIEKGVKFLEGEGLSKNIHTLWRAAENLIGFASGIATRTRKLVERARNINPNIVISTNRRVVPYTKKISVKAVNSGGASVHRLGLSESILIFENHYSFLGEFENLKNRIDEQKNSIAGKKIAIEAKDVPLAQEIAKSQSVDLLYLKDFSSKDIKEVKQYLTKNKLKLEIIASCDVDDENVEEFAKSGADIIVTSWPYYATPSNFDIIITPITF